MPQEANQAVVIRFYEELWNRWRLEIADQILTPTFRFRGSLGSTLCGRNEFKTYVQTFRSAFPDWHNHINEILSIDDRVITRMTWSGTHQGKLGAIDPTGAPVEYCGAGFFRLSEQVIDEAWIVGDTQELWRALGVLVL